MTTTKTFSARIPKDLLSEIQERCKERSISQADWLIELASQRLGHVTDLDELIERVEQIEAVHSETDDEGSTQLPSDVAERIGLMPGEPIRYKIGKNGGVYIEAKYPRPNLNSWTERIKELVFDGSSEELTYIDCDYHRDCIRFVKCFAVMEWMWEYEEEVNLECWEAAISAGVKNSRRRLKINSEFPMPNFSDCKPSPDEIIPVCPY